MPPTIKQVAERAGVSDEPQLTSADCVGSAAMAAPFQFDASNNEEFSKIY